MAGRPVSLTPTEYDLLCVLAQNEGKLLNQRAIVREAWGATHHEQANHLHVHDSQLRHKLEAYPFRPRYCSHSQASATASSTLKRATDRLTSAPASAKRRILTLLF